MAILALEDGKILRGQAFGAEGQVCGEVVFNTGLTGYQEVLTDPSYAGQIVCMTYPHIGNYGINSEDVESIRPWVTGFIVREFSQNFSNWRGRLTIDQYLKKYGVVGLCEIDTRTLTRHVREQGAMRGALASENIEPQELVARARHAPTISEFDYVRQVSCHQPYLWNEPLPRDWYGPQEAQDLHIVAIDYGIKRNILRHLRARATKITVVPCYWSAAQILNLQPDGIFLSNGPGDPVILKDAIRTARQLIEAERCPIFGICLGHQVLGLALGARAYKLKFGHRGCNQPVKNLLTEKIEITTHNHGFALKDLPPELELTHINLNDGSIEGFRHKKLPLFTVQYHPEAAPGPHDSHQLFEQFVELMRAPAPRQ